MRAAVLAAALLLGGCATTQPPLLSDAVELTAVPFFPQTDYQCGPAALATVLAHSGVAVGPADITDAVFIPDRKGSLQVELIAAARRNGRLPFVIPPQPGALLQELEAGRPVLVLQNLGFDRLPKWHYAVVVGHDPARDRFVLRSGRKERKHERSGRFLRSWARSGHWGLVVTTPDELPASASAERWARTVAGSEPLLDGVLVLQAYDTGLARWPDDSLLLFASANYRYGAGYAREARDQYRRLLAMHPDHAAARNNLASLLLEHGCVAAARGEIALALAALKPGDPLAPALEDTRAQTEAAELAASACPFD